MKTISIDETSFPLYGIKAITSNLLVCAGGGGAAKTGVKNAIHFYKLIEESSSFTSRCLCEHDTGARAVMNIDVHPDGDILAAGMDHLCQLFEIKYKKEEDLEKVVLEELKSIATVCEAVDDNDDGEYQKCVKFSPDGKLIITGGSDGSCKIYKYPSLDLLFTIKKAHNEEVDEISVHPDSTFFTTVSKDSNAGVWRTNDGLKETELSFSLDKKDDDFFRFRNCKFSKNNDTNTTHLYTTHIPKKYSKIPISNCLVKWDISKWIPEKSVFIKRHTLSALSACGSGRYVSVGTADGSVMVYTSWNLTHVQTVGGIHDIFVTGLSFLPESKMLCEDMQQDAAILSCSIDNKCQLTLLPSRSEYSLVAFMIVFVVVIGIVFNMITYFDLEF